MTFMGGVLDEDHGYFAPEFLTDPQNGYHLHWFKCYKKNNGEDFHRGSILSGFQRQVEARFSDRCDMYFLDNETLLKICEISRFASFPNVIKTKGYAVGGNTVFIAYEVFDDTFSSWAKTNSATMTQDWWIAQARNITESMYYMANKSVYHEGLERLESYIIFKSELHIRHVATKIPQSQKTQQSEIEKKCLVPLGHFMFEYARDKFEDHLEWEAFINAFEHSTIDQLRQHPFLLTGIERHKYFRKIANLRRNYMGETEQDKFKVMLNGLHHYDGWGKTLPSVFTLVLCHENGSNIQRTSFNLFLFIERLLDHYDKKADDHQHLNQKVSQVELERMISVTFPGFLSYVHHIILLMYPDVTKFPDVLRVTSYHSDVPSSFLRQRTF